MTAAQLQAALQRALRAGGPRRAAALQVIRKLQAARATRRATPSPVKPKPPFSAPLGQLPQIFNKVPGVLADFGVKVPSVPAPAVQAAMAVDALVNKVNSPILTAAIAPVFLGTAALKAIASAGGAVVGAFAGGIADAPPPIQALGSGTVVQRRVSTNVF